MQWQINVDSEEHTLCKHAALRLLAISQINVVKGGDKDVRAQSKYCSIITYICCLSLAQALVSHGLCPEPWFFMGPFCACTIKTGRHVEMQTIEGDIWYFWHRTTQAICQAMCQAIVFHGHARGQEILHEGPTIETEGGVLWYPVVLRLELLYPQKMIQMLQKNKHDIMESCGFMWKVCA